MDTQNINALLQRTAELEQELAAKNRELQIEAALDRVRTRAMAMERSDELKDLIATLSVELAQLNFVLDPSFIIIFDPQTKGMTWWMAHPETPNEPIGLFIQYHEQPPFLAHVKAWEERQLRWQYILEGDVKRTWDAFLFAETGLAQLPEPVIANMRSQTKVYLSASFNNFGALSVATLAPLSRDQFDVMLRFAKVFDQTYTRFNDLKRAEAQAREAQIEAALEKVRSRSLAMHRSSELKDVIAAVFEKLKELEVVFDASGIFLFKDGSDDSVLWVANPDVMSEPLLINLPYEEALENSALFKDIRKARTTGEDIYNKRYSFDEKNKYFEYVWKYNPQTPSNVKEFQLQAADYTHTVIMGKESALVADSWRGKTLTVEELDVLKRLGNVFEQAYTRFLDLQKAEAQAREAQIQLALERVRAKALAMQTSNDLIEVANVLREQMGTLGQPELESSIVHLYNGNAETFDVWYAYAAPHQSGSTITGFGTVPKNASEWTREVIAKYQSAETEYTIVSSGQKLREWYQVLETFAPDTIEYDEQGAMIVPEVLYYHFSKFSGGALLMISNQQPAQESRELQKRAAAVFDLAYTRFLDLKQAEMQAREAQIQLALERVRARTMAMQKSEELTDVAELLFKQVSELGIKAWTTGFNVWSDDNDSFTDYITSPQGGFIEPYTVTATLPILINARNRGDEFLVFYLEGETLKELYKELSKFGDKQQYEKMVEGGFQLPEHQYNHFVSGSKVSLMFITYEPVPEAHDIFKRFGKVFEQTYTRFLDLQRAEAQAREAKIEAAMEKLRSKAMAMQTSGELNTLVQTMYLELKKLDESLNRCFIMIFDVQTKDITWWMAGEGVDSAKHAYHVPFSEHPPQLAYLKGWEELQERWQYIMEGEEKRAWDEYLFTATELTKLPRTVIQYMRSFQKIYLSASFSNFGCLTTGSIQPLSDASFSILLRFAKVFDQTYTRFLDLQKAEAQAIRAEQDLIEIKAARKKAEDTLATLKATQQQLIQAEKMASLGELTAGIAHEIQNPLNFVNNFSDTNKELLEELKQELKNGNLEEVNAIASDVISNEEKINHHGKRAEAIVKSMLQHSRASKGEKQLTDINALTEEYLRLAYHGFRAKDKTFNVTLETSLDTTIGNINTVPQDIGRVLLNLFNNAFYAVHEHLKKLGTGYEPTVSVSTKNLKDKIEIQVQDNGMGISKSAIDKIFQPFFTTKPAGQGAGLGLSLTYDIIKAHGGELKVESEEGQYSLFRIQLPA